MISRVISGCVFFWILILLLGCIKEDISMCGNKVQFKICAVWDSSINKPEGIRVAIYPINADTYVVDNFPAEGGEMLINRGSYAFLIHNNDNITVRLRNIKKHETYEAYTSAADAPAYKPVALDEDMVVQPDALWVVNLERHDIDQPHTLTVYPKQIVHKYTFRLMNVVGLENVKAMRGSITGMMGTYFLNNSVVSAKPYTIYFENGKIENGIMFDISSFGVIDHTLENGAIVRRSHILTVEFMNKSEVVRYNIDVTDKLDLIPLGGEIDIFNEIEVPEGEDIEDGGFDAEVGDWDNVIVPLS